MATHLLSYLTAWTLNVARTGHLSPREKFAFVVSPKDLSALMNDVGSPVGVGKASLRIQGPADEYEVFADARLSCQVLCVPHNLLGRGDSTNVIYDLASFHSELRTSVLLEVARPPVLDATSFFSRPKERVTTLVPKGSPCHTNYNVHFGKESWPEDFAGSVFQFVPDSGFRAVLATTSGAVLPVFSVNNRMDLRLSQASVLVGGGQPKAELQALGWAQDPMTAEWVWSRTIESSFSDMAEAVSLATKFVPARPPEPSKTFMPPFPSFEWVDHEKEREREEQRKVAQQRREEAEW